jgi:hypothetical protein
MQTSPVMVYKVPRTLMHWGLYYCKHVPITAFTLLRMHSCVNKTDFNNLMDSMLNGSISDVFGHKE